RRARDDAGDVRGAAAAGGGDVHAGDLRAGRQRSGRDRSIGGGFPSAGGCAGEAGAFTPPRVASRGRSINRGLSRPLCAGEAGAFTPPRVASRGRSIHRGRISRPPAAAPAKPAHSPLRAPRRAALNLLVCASFVLRRILTASSALLI